jgi:di/tricarboxylate transporter
MMSGLSTEIILTFAVLGITIFLFVSEWLRVDVVALCVMLSLSWLGLVEPHEALAGMSSKDRSGIMAKVTRPILRVAGSSERRLVSLVSAAVGTISAFMQNIGAAALFLPAILRIAKRLKLSESRLLMPVGFAAILGGTLTMVASGPLIILNDILRQGGQDSFGLFAVTPVGLTLLIAGILYFFVLGPLVLPKRKGQEDETNPLRRRTRTGVAGGERSGCALRCGLRFRVRFRDSRVVRILQGHGRLRRTGGGASRAACRQEPPRLRLP